LTRSHWAGVENRNHYRRDATLGEDGTRMRNPNALAKLALVRSANLRLMACDCPINDWLSAKKERLRSDIPAAFTLLRSQF